MNYENLFYLALTILMTIQIIVIVFSLITNNKKKRILDKKIEELIENLKK